MYNMTLVVPSGLVHPMLTALNWRFFLFFDYKCVFLVFYFLEQPSQIHFTNSFDNYSLKVFDFNKLILPKVPVTTPKKEWMGDCDHK